MRIACWSGVVVALGLLFGACLIDQRSVFPRFSSGGDGAAGGDGAGADAPGPADDAGGDAPGPADSAGGDSTSICGNGVVELPAEVCDSGNPLCGACGDNCTQIYSPATGRITVAGPVMDEDWVELCLGMAGGPIFELDMYTAAYLLTGIGEAAVVWTARTPGEGGNSITVELVNPGGTTGNVVVTVNASAITVTLRTTGDILSSTAHEVVDAVNGHFLASQLVVAAVLDGNGGNGVVQAFSQHELGGGSDGDGVSVGALLVPVVDGEEAGEVAVALAAAINASTVLPLTATVELQASPMVQLEARHVGLGGCTLESSTSSLSVQGLTGGGGVACAAGQPCVNTYDCLSGNCHGDICQ